VARTAAKDLLRARAAHRYRDVGEREWRDAELAFVWQHHDLFHRSGEPLARRRRIPLVSYVHAPQVWEARRWGVRRPGWGSLLERAGERPQLHASDVVACVSDEVAHELLRLGVPPERMVVSPMAVDAERFAPGLPREEIRATLGVTGRFVVGWVGTFRRFHGLESLVDAFARLHSVDRSARLLLVGSGAEREPLQQTVERRGLADAVVFVGAVPHADVPRLVAGMDVAVVSAPAEPGFHYSPQKLREYLACARPTVAPRVGEVPRLVTEGREALLYDPGASEELSNQLLRLRDDAECRTRIGAAGRELVVKTATWDVRLRDLMSSDAFRGASAVLRGG
jgi:glycosyltransferase involved in cell wall biosynthesis